MSKSLKAHAIIEIEIYNLKEVFIENEYFRDKDDDRVLDFDKSDIEQLRNLMSWTSDADEINDFQELIGSIEKYGKVTAWLGF